MNFVQIFILFLGVFVHRIQAQGLLFPQGKAVKHSAKNQAEESNIDSEHSIITDKKSFIAPIPIKNQEPIIGSDAALPSKTNKNQTLNNVISNSTDNLTSSLNHLPKINQTLEEKVGDSPLSSGAITRAILVFVILSFLFILYVGIKTYRRKSQDKRRTIVRKYGVRARRSDVEMEPLPLSDDDEDETVFDLAASRGNTT